MSKFKSFKARLILSGFAILLIILAVILKGVMVSAPAQPVIEPANPKIAEDNPVLEKTAPSAKVAEIDSQSVILSANKETLEEYNGESTKNFSVDESFSSNGLNISIKNITLATLSKQNMEEMGLFGDGLLDVTFKVKNESQTDIQIYPSLLKFSIDDESYPVNANPAIRDGNIAAGETAEGSVVAQIYSLSSPDEVKEFSFNWKTTKNKISHSSEVVIILE